MPPAIANPTERIKAYFRNMAADILIIYGEKGFAPFKRPLTIAAPVLLIIYMAVYSPTTSNLSKTKRNIASMTIVAQYAEQYEASKTRMRSLQQRLPLVKDKDEWLSYVINSTARTVGVTVDSLGAQSESEMSGYLVVSREVQTTTTYGTLGKWLAEIENSPIFLRVTELNMQRDQNSPGNVRVSFTLSTVFPRFGGGS